MSAVIRFPLAPGMTVYVRLRGGKIQQSTVSNIVLDKSKRHIIYIKNETRCYNMSDIGSRIFLNQEDAEKKYAVYRNNYSLKADLNLSDPVIILKNNKTEIEHIETITFNHSTITFKTENTTFTNIDINSTAFLITEKSQNKLIDIIIDRIRKTAKTSELGDMCAKLIIDLKHDREISDFNNIIKRQILSMADLFAYTKNIAECDTTTKEAYDET